MALWLRSLSTVVFSVSYITTEYSTVTKRRLKSHVLNAWFHKGILQLKELLSDFDNRSCSLTFRVGVLLVATSFSSCTDVISQMKFQQYPLRVTPRFPIFPVPENIWIIKFYKKEIIQYHPQKPITKLRFDSKVIHKIIFQERLPTFSIKFFPFSEELIIILLKSIKSFAKRAYKQWVCLFKYMQYYFVFIIFIYFIYYVTFFRSFIINFVIEKYS